MPDCKKIPFFIVWMGEHDGLRNERIKKAEKACQKDG